MKKFVCILTLFVVCLCMSCEYAENNTDNSDNLDLIKKVGQCERPLTDSEKGKIILKGDSISIFEGELEQVTERCKLTGKENPEKHAKEYLLHREALYQIALAAGYSVTDDEVYANIEKQKKDFHEVDINPEEVNAYFEGMGMTIDEYWDTQFDTLKKEMISDQYVRSLKDQFAEEQFAKGYKKTLWHNNIKKDFQAKLSKIEDDYIASDHIKDISS